MVEQFLWGADLHQLAGVEDGQAIAHLQRLVDVVGDEDDGLAQPLLQGQHGVLQPDADERIKGREGFVHQDDVGIGRQRPRQPHALAHAARELLRIAVGHVGQFHLAQPVAGALALLFGRQAPHTQAEAGVLHHRQMRQQPEVLEHHADPGTPELAQAPRIQRRDIGVAGLDAAAGGLDEPVDVAHQRGFARAGQSDDAEDAA